MNYEDRNRAVASAYGLLALINKTRKRATARHDMPNWLLSDLAKAATRAEKSIVPLIEFRNIARGDDDEL